MINSVNSYSSYYNNYTSNNENSKTKISNNNSNLVNDKTQAVSKTLGYGVDSEGYFTSDFNEAAALPKDYKIYAKGVENFVNYYTSSALNPTGRAFTSIDIAKSLGRAYQVFSQLAPKVEGNFTQEDINNIPQYFQWNDKTLEITKIYTKEEYISVANARNEESSYSSLKDTLSFPDWANNSPYGWLDKKADIFDLSTHIDIGKNAYTNTDGSISKGGVFMAFFANTDSSIYLMKGETTVFGKMIGVDDNFSVEQRKELEQFLKDSPIFYATHDDPGAELLSRLKLRSNISDVEEFKQEWLKMKAKSDEAGERYKEQIAKQNSQTSQTQENNEENSNKTFTPIQGESQNKETYKDNNIRNELLKKLLENRFDTRKQLELLFEIKFNDDKAYNEFNQLFSQISLNHNNVDLRV